MKILFLDIETTPLKVDVWALFNQTVSLNQINEPTRMMCFAYKWKGGAPGFYAEWGNYEWMVPKGWQLLDEADVVVTWNGDHFDIPHLNREFLEIGLQPPSPYKSVDLYKQVKKKFRFPSNKLQYVSTALGFDGKTEHTGHKLWQDCMTGDVSARRLMEKYNIQDVVLLEQIFDRMQSWVDMPNANLYVDLDEDGCPQCGSATLIKEGFAYTANGRYQRYLCTDCGKWSRSSKRADGSGIQVVK